MGLFSRKRVVGTMRLDFLSQSEVVVTDRVPDSTSEVPYPLWFAFFYAGKLLFNFPPPSGHDVVTKAMSVLGPRVDPEDPLRYNESMLGVCCEHSFSIVDRSEQGRWVYSAELLEQGDGLVVNTEVAHGHEDHFHRAAIDTVFEVVRRRLGENGGAVCAGAIGYFWVLQKHGCEALDQNLHFAASAAMQAASWTGWPE